MTARLGERISETSWFDTLDQPRRWWPVAIEYTETRIFLVEADTAEEAIRSAQADPDILEEWEHADRTDWSSMDVPDGWSQTGPVDSWRIDHDAAGPREACRRCGAVATNADERALRYANHAGDCPAHIHRARITAAWGPSEDPKYTIVGYRPECSCEEPGFKWEHRRPDEPDERPYWTKEVAEGMARDHAINRPHSRHDPLGLPGREIDARTVQP